MTSFVYTYQTIIKAPIEDVWTFFSSAINLTKITSFPKVEISSDPRTIEGNDIEMKLGIGGIKVQWVSHIHDVQENKQFIDTGIKLPFPLAEWKHVHTFTEKAHHTVMVDTVYLKTMLPSFMLKPLLNGMFKGREKAINDFFHNN